MKDKGIPDLFIEKLLLDELPRSMKERLLQDPSVRRRLEELKADNRRILEEHPPEEMAKAIRNRGRFSRRSQAAQGVSAGEPRRRLNWPRLVPAAGFALLVLAGGLLLLTRGPHLFAPGGQAADIRLKGGAAHLNIYMKTDGGARLLEEGDRVAEGTTVQIGYVSGSNEYGVIVSIDGRGTVTLHFPTSPMTGVQLEEQGEVLLPFAYTLDDAPDFERFFFVVSEKSFSAATVLEAADKLAEKPESVKTQDLDLPGRLEQSAILLLKQR